ncbi:hypothetical protein E5345_02425 [Propionibacterium sp. NM47_B9-13]|jgi:hypothetical protein|uniref:Uncharacterized protein n=2 Tax=Cutibacterium modestum TaxID=2559073 RepID=A0ABP2K6R5_9ACTN|nr:hypothetical protein BCB70_08010 [Cutibacterium modestum]EFS74032.1 hypothetical protein HMPREF9621_01570 [Cutibacterium modestum HL037PA2]EFS92613.1 hypothetical protein HMPREF9607_01143 [Cutibacterium modestum HL044PA1]MCP2377002.1 hypothetical protein [Cutibacterium modestum 28N]MCP2377831.1 hypothetical protein [Cutibacterium modestum 31N]MCP2381606.1 hypothetical protein [Cutibacterium modestum 30N]TGY30136.1 hypothetical protein E5345_02425 [Propionibacterium sp. NM47_B9-13]
MLPSAPGRGSMSAVRVNTVTVHTMRNSAHMGDSKPRARIGALLARTSVDQCSKNSTMISAGIPTMSAPMNILSVDIHPTAIASSVNTTAMTAFLLMRAVKRFL